MHVWSVRKLPMDVPTVWITAQPTCTTHSAGTTRDALVDIGRATTSSTLSNATRALATPAHATATTRQG